LKHGECLGPHQDFAPVDAVDNDPGHGCEKECRYLPGEAYGAQQKRGFGEAVDEPGGRDARHPRADEGDALAAEEETKIAMAQSPPCVREVACSARAFLILSLWRHLFFRCVSVPNRRDLPGATYLATVSFTSIV